MISTLNLKPATASTPVCCRLILVQFWEWDYTTLPHTINLLYAFGSICYWHFTSIIYCLGSLLSIGKPKDCASNYFLSEKNKLCYRVCICPIQTLYHYTECALWNDTIHFKVNHFKWGCLTIVVVNCFEKTNCIVMKAMVIPLQLKCICIFEADNSHTVKFMKDTFLELFCWINFMNQVNYIYHQCSCAFHCFPCKIHLYAYVKLSLPLQLQIKTISFLRFVKWQSKYLYMLAPLLKFVVFSFELFVVGIKKMTKI